jgi:hypothetical protein
MEKSVKMRTLFSLLAGFVLASGMVYGQTACLQDQYGNQYNFTVDETNAYVYGSVTSGPNQCKSSPWNMTGSFVTGSGGLGFEITAANPDPSNGCPPIFTLKGIWPNFNWYYVTGVSDQPGTWVACGTKVLESGVGKGSLKH